MSEPTATRVPTKIRLSPTPMPTNTKTAIPESGPWEACAIADYLSRLRVGDYAKVSEDPPLSNRVRSKPNLSGTIEGLIKPGEEIVILDGPGCSSGWVWWRVRSTKTGLEGWTAEGDDEGYWLVPKPK